MAFLGRGKKEDLLSLADELGLKVNAGMKIFELKDAIISNEKFDEEFAKELFFSIVETRKKKEELEEARRKDEIEEARRKEELEEARRKEALDLEERRRKEEMEEARRKDNFELEKLRIEAEIVKNSNGQTEQIRTHSKQFKILIHSYEPKEDISLYLILFERQARQAELPEESWVTYLLGLLPFEITEIIAREPEINVQKYSDVKDLLLKRFKLTPEKFRQLFTKHQKANEKTWQDFCHELYNYFNGWISGLNVSTFEQLRDLIISDQIKKRAPLEFKDYFIDEWTTFTSPMKLAEKIEEFEDIKKTIKPKFSIAYPKPKGFYKSDQSSTQYRWNNKKEEKSEKYKTEADSRQRNYYKEFDRRKSLRCYECGSTEHLRPLCPKIKRGNSDTVNNILAKDSTSLLAPYTFNGKINGVECEILRDSGATIDIAPRRYVSPKNMTGEHVWVQQPLDSAPICLPVAEIMLECELGSIVTKAAIVPNELDKGRYLLGNRTAEIFEEFNQKKEVADQLNAVQTRRQKLLQEKKDEVVINPEIDADSTLEENKDPDELVILPEQSFDDPIVSLLKIDKETFEKHQRNSQELKPIIEQAQKTTQDDSTLKYIIKNNLLLKRKIDKTGQERLLLVIPEEFRESIKTLCHEGTSAHLGVTKTKDRLARHFFWNNCYKDLEYFVKTCHKCQKAGKAGEKTKAPLKLVPIIQEIFTKVNVDAVGPLPVTSTGKRYIITAMCLSSKYPDAVAVSDITSVSVVDALLQIFSRMGFPKEIQHDQGTSFMSVLTSEFLERFGIKIVHSSVYHPQSNPVERFHRTLKRILRVLCLEAAPDWEQHIHAALFALRTVTHESTGFSPSELVHGRNLRTPIALLYENWMQPEEENNSVVEYIFNLINRLKRCQELAIQKMEESAVKRKLWYDKGSVKREFKEGDKVLVLATSTANKLSVQWHGPGTIESKISDTNYIVNLPGRKENQIYHVNLLSLRGVLKRKKMTLSSVLKEEVLALVVMLFNNLHWPEDPVTQLMEGNQKIIEILLKE